MGSGSYNCLGNGQKSLSPPSFFLSRGKGRKNGLLQIIKPGFFVAVAVVFVALRRMGAVVLSSSECLAWTTRREEKAFAVVLQGGFKDPSVGMAGGRRRRDTPPSSLLCCMACLLPPPSPPPAAAWNQVPPREGFDKECASYCLRRRKCTKHC